MSFVLVILDRPVRKGEEITIAYIPQALDREIGNGDESDSRRSRLQAQFDFTCECAVCDGCGGGIAAEGKEGKEISRGEALDGQVGGAPNGCATLL